MGKNSIDTLASEVELILNNPLWHKWHRVEAILQLIERENILTGNRIRRRHGEPEVIPEVRIYKQNKVEWLIDVPKEWYSLTGKDATN